MRAVPTTAFCLPARASNLNVQTLGPRRIVVGKEAVYEVTIQNSGEVAADDVVVFVGLPEWAGVAGAVASVGDTHPVPQGRAEPFSMGCRARGRQSA